MVEKLKYVRKGLKEWRKKNGWSSKEKIESLKKELRSAYASSSFASDFFKQKEVE